MTSLAFGWDGTLYSGQRGGIRRWDLDTGRSVPVLECLGRIAVIRADAAGRRLVAVCGTETGGHTTKDPEVFVLDLSSGARWPVRSHGPEVAFAVLDRSGQWLVTADSTGLVRVGRAEGGDPHLLPGGPTPNVTPTVSPDGRWVAAGSGSDIHLWPMPDMTRPPFHTLPHEELMARLRSFTNLEVVEDDTSPTGYRTEVGPFPGWDDVPTWRASDTRLTHNDMLCKCCA